MKKITLLTAVLGISGCAQSTPEYDPASVISDYNASITSANYNKQIKYHTTQPVNKSEPCVISIDSDIETHVDNLKWFGSCVNGKANGLGLFSSYLNGKLTVIVSELSEKAGSDIDYYRYTPSENSYAIGVSRTEGFEGKVLLLNNNAGYLSAREGYTASVHKSGISYTLLRDNITGTSVYIKSYKSGTAITLFTMNDYTNNINQGIKVFVNKTLSLEVAKLQNGSVMTNQQGKFYDAKKILPFIESQLSEVDRQLANAPVAYTQAIRKITLLQNNLCMSKDKENEDVKSFCEERPFASYSREFERSSEAFKSAQQQRLANAENIRLQAMKENLIRQQNYEALNASLAQLNQTTQQVQRNLNQSSAGYTAPTPVIQNYNQMSIYTCQNVSNWSYCRQQR